MKIDRSRTIKNIEEGKMIGAESKTAPSYTATTATFDVNLLYPGASAEYIITVAKFFKNRIKNSAK